MITHKTVAIIAFTRVIIQNDSYGFATYQFLSFMNVTKIAYFVFFHLLALTWYL